MPIYRIEQYELYAQTYEVDAPSPAAALDRVLNGRVDAGDDAPDYIDVCDTMGMPLEQNVDLVNQLRDMGHMIGHTGIVDSIRSIEEVEE